MFKLFRHVFTSMLRKYATRLYPYEGARVPDGFRGKLYHLPEKCIYCGACQRVCPTGAIKVEPNKSWSYDMKKCIYCGACQEVCSEVIKANAIHLTKHFSMVHPRLTEMPRVVHFKAGGGKAEGK